MKTTWEKNRTLSSIEELRDWLQLVLAEIPPSAIILLSGHLGAGKTTLVRTAAEILQCGDWVNSPTFNLVNRYDALYQNSPLIIYHIDCYRTTPESPQDDIDIEEFYHEEGAPFYAFIEWPEKSSIDWERREIPVYRLTIDPIWDNSQPIQRRYHIKKTSK